MSRLSALPYNEKVFSDSILSYEEALDISKYKKRLLIKEPPINISPKI